jgi:Ca-activated chloride channel family protein
MKAKGMRLAALFIAVTAATLHGQQASPDASAQGERFKFRSAVELVNVTATVSDASGRFVSGLQKDDFIVYEDDQLQTITHFSSERVPVSLGLVLDTSGSMDGDKIRAARSALERLLSEMTDPDDEFFLYQFADDATLLQGWTSDRKAVSRALGRIDPNGDTAMYDAVAAAIPLAAEGRNRKKALIVISDGNDTSSVTRISELRRMVRESEVLVYAIGIDGDGESSRGPVAQPPFPPRGPTIPFPIPRRFPPRPPLRQLTMAGQWPPVPRSPTIRTGRYDGVNDLALRELTDDSGGRTEIVRSTRDLAPATGSIADELSKQYYLGYPAGGRKDGRWHAIRVEVKTGEYRVRARRGYVAS